MEEEELLGGEETGHLGWHQGKRCSVRRGAPEKRVSTWHMPWHSRVSPPPPPGCLYF